MARATPKIAARNAHARAILGPDLSERLAETKVLLVGAGGIGCELLKNLVLTGFGHITLLDLDTIDLSNLNRQFLFRKKDVKKSKAMVSAQTAGPFNPNVQIQPIHGNIKDPQFDMEWFRSFDIVLNALDNLDARRHVNKMCMAAQVPLVESGTAGYLGQVQPLLKDRTECFDCIPKPTPKTFPVCTIRSTPSQPIHCIVWAKSYLLGQFFGEDEDASGELDEAEKQGENAQEIATLRKEAQAFKAVRAALRSKDSSGNAARMAFEKASRGKFPRTVFDSDIRNLLSMSDMWRSRAPPVPLDFDAIMKGSFVLRGTSTVTPTTNANGNKRAATNGQNSASTAGLKDQRALSLQENLALFVSSTERLAARLRAGEETISFDKDDDDTLDFVTAAANLRSAAYGITGKSRWEIKEMAGNIIPAIATTNAIVAGLIVLQAMQLLKKSYGTLRNVHLQFKPSMPLSTVMISPPNNSCGICRNTYTSIQCDPAKVTLGQVVRGILGDVDREVSVYEDRRVLCDPDWDDNNERTLESLNVTRGKFLTIVDEDGEIATIEIGICNLPSNHSGDPLILPSPLPDPPRKTKVSPPSPSTPPKKRPAPDDEDVTELEPAMKRLKTNGASNPNLYTPTKKRRLEDDGLVLLDTPNEKVEDDDVIEID
ncbi:hypothetical protein NEOLEDRAFT_1072604 [Neolentinus lepideus HHB14362 ss-1]|uniref:Ubiquitin-activating enzyme E1-like n=1 Tax=Neolentinus lepideus HHB14362 ss-1 TaxID=1314782 RepID=A0A165Q4A5_9AGAM|nr:hypothetical protein NEOLEDRAFT_1072604 [Neolentinus lepideus HHB14362 ss-1]